MSRLFLLIAVLGLFVDALYFSGGYTQLAFKQVAIATERLVAPLGQASGNGEQSKEL